MRKLMLLAALAAALPASATTVTFDTLPNNTDHGTYNGFVGGTVAGVRFDNLISDDYYHKTYIDGRPWEYKMSTIAKPQFVRFGGLDEYRIAALLLAGDGAKLGGLVNATTPAEISDYQYALWRLFSPTAPLVGGSGAVLKTAESENLSNPAFAASYARLRIWTPNGNRATESNQEFLQLAPVAPTPEPGTAGMLGAGFALIVASTLRRRTMRR